MNQLSGLDAMFLYWETQGSSMHTAMLSVYDASTAPGGAVAFEAVREHLQLCLPVSDVFRQRLAMVPMNVDHPYWIRDPDFDLDRHLHRVSLEEPTWNAFCELAAKEHGRPLKRDRPLWEMVYIDGVGGAREDFPPGSFALLLKIHHAAIDGASAAGIIGGLHDLTPDAPPKQFDDAFEAEKLPSKTNLLMRSALNNMRTPARLVGPLQRILPGLSRGIRPNLNEKMREWLGEKRSGKKPQRRGPDTRFNGRANADRIYEAREYPLTELAAIRKAVPGATVNDVILTIASGGMREYLAAKGELPNESLLSMVPISTRGEGPAAGGNEVTLMILPLQTQIADPLERLTAVAAESGQAKESINAVGARDLTELNKAAPASMMAMSLRLATASNFFGKLRAFNTVVSNVPGPRDYVYLSGAKMLYWSGLGPCSHGIAFGMPVLSYAGKVNFSLSGCTNAVPDPEFAAQCLDKAYEELKHATIERQPAPTKKAQPRKKASTKG